QAFQNGCWGKGGRAGALFERAAGNCPFTRLSALDAHLNQLPFFWEDRENARFRLAVRKALKVPIFSRRATSLFIPFCNLRPGLARQKRGPTAVLPCLQDGNLARTGERRSRLDSREYVRRHGRRTGREPGGPVPPGADRRPGAGGRMARFIA